MFEGIDAWKAAGYPVVPEAPPPGDLILNPSVEDGDVWPYYWSRGKAADVSGEHVWSSIAANGSRSLVVRIQSNLGAAQSHAVFWYQKWNLDDPDCPFTRGSTYIYRAWYQTDNATMRIYVGMWDISYKWIQSANNYTDVRSATPSTWEQSNWITFTVPADAKYIAVGMAIRLAGIDDGVSQALGRADDFEVLEIG